MSTPNFETTVLLRSEETSGEVSAIENVVPPHWQGPPLHHHDFDETFYVAGGELTFQLGDELTTAGPGEVVFAPRGSHHTLANLGEEEARYLLICTPGGFERYFGRLQAELAGAEPPEWAMLPTPEVTTAGPSIGNGGG